jgi:predicted acylesterase/phospholipase RssA
MSAGKTGVTRDLGLALSGGGSRAAAFHRGTIAALIELGLIDRVRVVSTVSGGSVFGAAWLAARARGESDDDFLAAMRGQLAKGFILRALVALRTLLVPFPGTNRTHLLADAFDRYLFRGPKGAMKLADLPVEPVLCLNTAVMNHAMPGRFSRTGYSGSGVGESEKGATSYPQVECDVTLGFATACSAAFPFGLPPLSIKAGRFKQKFSGEIKDHDRLVLTDGGVLENLGVERLIKSDTFGARHILISDAGVADVPWQPNLISRVKSFFIYALSPATLEKLLLMMNDKQNKSMRELAYARVDRTLDTDRAVLFVRVDQTWGRMISGIPGWRRKELGIPVHKDPSVVEDPAAIEAALAGKVDLARAKALYVGDERAKAANKIGTNFTGLDDGELDLLDRHAQWQVHAMHALYGEKLSKGVT